MDGQAVRLPGSPVPAAWPLPEVRACDLPVAGPRARQIRGPAGTYAVIMQEQRAGRVVALLHGLAVLDLFERDRTVVGVVDIANNLGVHRSTASRLAATLASAGYLEAAGEPGRYRLAPKLATLGEIAAVGADLRRAAAGPLRDLVSELGETTHLGILEGTEAVTIDVIDGWQTVRMHSWVGKRSPAHCSSMGKALLAALSPEEFAARYPGPDLESRTPATITGTDGLRKQLDLIRAQGYAEDLEELEPHLCCVAAPVFGREGIVVASISISGPASRLGDPTVRAAAAGAVRATADLISSRLGAPKHAGCGDALPDGRMS